MTKCLRVKDLIEKLKEFDENLPVVVTHCGRDHQYGITLADIFITDYGYFGNDNLAEIEFKHETEFLNIAQI